jgi:hypothetical protein
MNGDIILSFTRVFQIKCLLTMGRQWQSEVKNIFHTLTLSSCCQAYSAASHTLAGEQHVFLIDASPLFSEKGRDGNAKPCELRALAMEMLCERRFS